MKKHRFGDKDEPPPRTNYSHLKCMYMPAPCQWPDYVHLFVNYLNNSSPPLGVHTELNTMHTGILTQGEGKTWHSDNLSNSGAQDWLTSLYFNQVGTQVDLLNVYSSDLHSFNDAKSNIELSTKFPVETTQLPLDTYKQDTRAMFVPSS